MADFEIAERHDLEKEQILNEYGKLLPIAGEFADMKILEARPLIVEKLRTKGLVVKEEPYIHNVATAERTGGIIEPQIKLQWFIDVEKPFTLLHSEIPGIESGSTQTLKGIMRTAVESDAVRMPQDGFRNAYLHWIDNLRDWCISRQIWFGHRIPVWYGGEQIHVGMEAPSGEGWTQDPDVLDTWFSSALWTFSTLGWPEDTVDLRTYHPTSFMSPAYEILNLWVSRMILMSGFHLGQVPFKTVMIHGLVRDAQGRKFSKSLNNGIDPLDMIEKYGADALRMGLLIGAAIGSDISFDESRVKGYKHFANKLWNITRFVLENTEGSGAAQIPLEAADELLKKQFDELAADVTRDMEEYRVYLAAEKLYHYAWHELADKILEDSKTVLGTAKTPSDAPEQLKDSKKAVLSYLLDRTIRMLHPFMPFVTEEIWQSMPSKDAKFLMVARWPS
jgi:valyl-tRNA synthetase